MLVFKFTSNYLYKMRARRDVFQAIADPTRRAIIQMIAVEPLDIKTLTERFEVSQQAVSLHVKLLVDCGLVRMEQRGRNRFCIAQLGKLGEVADWAGQYRQAREFNLENLGAHLEKLRKERTGKQHTVRGDRELQVSQLLDAPIELVWKVWTKSELLAQWWGPEGSSTTISRMELKPGGKFNLVMRGPGIEVEGLSVFREVERHRKIVYQNLSTPRFTTTILLEERGEQTFMTWSVVFEMIREFTAATEKYNAVEVLNQTVQRLARFVVQVNRAH